MSIYKNEKKACEVSDKHDFKERAQRKFWKSGQSGVHTN